MLKTILIIFALLIFLITGVSYAQTNPDVFCFNKKVFCNSGVRARCLRRKFKPRCDLIVENKPICCKKKEKTIVCKSTLFACPSSSGAAPVPVCTPPPIGSCCSACTGFDSSSCSCSPPGCEKSCNGK